MGDLTVTFFIWLITATLIATALLTYLLILAINVWRMRDRVRVEAQPRARPTSENDLPTLFRDAIAETTPGMLELGFTVAANVHMPSFSTVTRGTQVLYLNRAAGDRASLQLFQEGKIGVRRLTFVTDFDDGTTVRTSSAGAGERAESRTFNVALKGERNPRTLYAAHLKNVAEHAPPEAKRILPQPGEEVAFIERRNAYAIKQTLPSDGWELDPSGTFYRMSWRRAIRKAALTMWPIRNLVRRWYTKKLKQTPA